MSRRLHFIRALPAVLLAALCLPLLTGCEESVDPVLGTDQRFTIYGFLNPLADTQAVRVFSIDDRLEMTAPVPLDAVVYTESEGETSRVMWRDSIVTYRDGSVGHVFHAAFRPDFATEHRFVIESPDGTLTTSTVETPPMTEPELGEIISAAGNVLIPIEWNRAPRILETRVIYHLKSRLFGDTRIFDKTVTLPTGQIAEGPGGEFLVVVRPSVDIGQLFTILALRPGVDELFLESMDIQAFVAGDSWNPPTGGFDPELLVQPGTFTNVVNGFGFLGTGYFDSFVFVPPDDVAEDAGFDILDG